jgi:hypothetical protein
MGRSRAIALWLSALGAASALAGCENHEKTASGASSGESIEPLPSLPAWAQPMAGKTFTDFKSSSGCEGWFDIVSMRHTGPSPGVEGEGWSWLTKEAKAPEHIVFVDSGGGVVGAGETRLDRPDVTKAKSEVTTPKVGWHGVIARSTGQIRAFAVLSDGSFCPVGSKDIGS